MDVLGDVLAVSGVRGAVGARIEAGQDWGWWWTSARPRAALHAVTAGIAWLGRADEPPMQLMPGDVVLLAAGPDHVLASDRQALARTTAARYDRWHTARDGAVRIGSGPVQTHILCADYDHDAAASTQLLTLLPDVVHIRAHQEDARLDDVVRLLGHELANPQLAGGVVLDRLVDILLVHVIRGWLASRAADGPPSWLTALADPVIGAAIARLHADPSRGWTTPILAREVDVSRSTLARRFNATVGESPGAYLTRWRMDLAARRLRATDDPLTSVAVSVGYESVYAFSRAFRRAWSVPPGQYRTSSRSS